MPVFLDQCKFAEVKPTIRADIVKIMQDGWEQSKRLIFELNRPVRNPSLRANVNVSNIVSSRSESIAPLQAVRLRLADSPKKCKRQENRT